MSPRSEPIAAVASYSGAGVVPVIAQTFTAGTGWQPHTARTPVTRERVRAPRARSVSSVALEHDGRLVDFRVRELPAVDRLPLLPGELVGSPHRSASERAAAWPARDGGRG